MTKLQNIDNSSHPVILFIPEAGIYPYLRGLSVLGDSIQRCGGKVLITHDTGQMLRSPMMAAYNTSVDISKKERTKIHNLTEGYFKNVLKKYKFSSIELSDLVDNQLNKEIASLTDNVHGDLREITYKGFPVGKIAEFDFILETKFPYYSNLSTQHKKLYIQYIKNTALALAITDKICERYKPSLFLTFNEYAQCQAVKQSATNHNIRYMMLTYPVHFNIDASRFSICKPSYSYWRYLHSQSWDKGKNTPINTENIIASWKDSIFRMYSSGSHIFSSSKKNDPKVIFNKFNLDPKRKTIVVYTSSQDERKCSEITMSLWKEDNRVGDVFKDQIEWLSWLRDYAAKNVNVQIIVRVHPREGIRQFGFSSQHLQNLKAKFGKDTSNFMVIWPDDPTSSYDLMELADACLIAWSIVGQEAAKLGIPVLTYTRNMYYPDDDFIQVASTLKEYKDKLDNLIKMGYSWRHLVKATRLYHWRTFVPSLDLSKNIPADFDDRSIWPKLPMSTARLINNILSGKEDLIEHNIKRWKKSLSKNTFSQETKAMKKGIRYFLDKIFYPPKNMELINRIWRYGWRKISGNYLWVPKDSFKDYHLKYTEDLSKMDILINQTKYDSELRVLIADGRYAILLHNGRVMHRMSPMAIRLARLHENA